MQVCLAQDSRKKESLSYIKEEVIVTGADRVGLYIDKLKNKTIAIVANQTSIIKLANKQEEHIVDYLHANKQINVAKVFAPEHGFRGKADAGETVKDGIDQKTKLPIISLYGKNKKPYPSQLKNIDVVVFDIQDVGARFYTYISTLHYVMEACAAAKIPVLLLDRPNPNGAYIDGPILENKHKSFVGMHPVPIVYGMTIGEYGTMINGEKWLDKALHCDLTVIPLKNYNHNSSYNLPIKPSPNLPNAKAIELYPSLCFFEGTNVSVGRGTDKQFQIIGTPAYKIASHNFAFTPKPNEGAKYPKHENLECYGLDLRKEEKPNKIELKWLVQFYKAHQENNEDTPFFNAFFTKLAGTKKLQQQIESNTSVTEIRSSWEKELNLFKVIRKKYLLYK
ncbi:exo-beta-N-acetylmuramidase NamZ domain-containing protein [Tenacibaculum sp. SG-28]|uniref:exo-beta-N-acetylmuramidase NamZ family protein n=1 Tax=Tenacibaculum sp. SG-28 TaxID=754426 RepID=UPI001E337B6D|nr:DUF1343 domain-containing protein [Tenacibaculum sp. SG-28]